MSLSPEEHIISVAIVEDQEDIRENVGDIIDQSEGIECKLRYRSAEEAMQFLPHAQPNIVLLDIHLPGMNGVDLLKLIRDQCLRTSFMMFSIFDDDQHIFEALKAGASGYITKRTSTAKIIDAIRELHQGGSPMSPEIAKKVLDFVRGYSIDKVDINPYKLSPREMELLEKLATGRIYREIADDMGIMVSTIKQYINSIYKKMQVLNRTEAINKYLGR